MPEKQISEELREQIKKLQAPNIAVIGGTGVGKSSLINAVFGKDLAVTGAGLPVTNGFYRYPAGEKSRDAPIVIYDSAGYEAAKTTEFVEGVLRFLVEQISKGLEEQIHLVWYVINAASGRVQPFEETIIENINQKNIPAVIILSQCDRAKQTEIDGIKEALKTFKLNNVHDIIEVAASPLEFQGKPICKPFGLKELVDKTIELLPAIYTDAVIAAQVVKIQGKRELAWKYISAAAGACFALQASPTPLGTPALIAAHTGLCISIASVYGYREVGEFLSSISNVTALNTLIFTTLGDLIGTFFPPANLGPAIVSASYVVAFGWTCTAVFEQMAKDNLQGKSKQEIEEYLKARFKEEFAKHPVLIPSPQSLEIVKKSFLLPE